MSRRTTVAFLLAAVLVILPSRAEASSTGGTSYRASGTAAQAPASSTAPASTTVPPGTVGVPATPATVGPDGLAIAPPDAPPQVVALIAAGNQIAKLPYKYGGGHGDFVDTAYDCSGSVSFALHGAGLLDETLDSTSLERFGRTGPGSWLTIYANKVHTYLIVAGVRFDTSGQAKAGTRWQAAPRSARGFKVRHPAGL